MTARVIDLPTRIGNMHQRINTLESRSGWRLEQIKRLRAKNAVLRAQLREQDDRHRELVRALHDRLIDAGCEHRRLMRLINELHADNQRLHKLHDACYCHTEEHNA